MTTPQSKAARRAAEEIEALDILPSVDEVAAIIQRICFPTSEARAALADAEKLRKVSCVSCIEGDAQTIHIFSTQEKRDAWIAADNGRIHVCWDYLVDFPQAYEREWQ